MWSFKQNIHLIKITALSAVLCYAGACSTGQFEYYQGYVFQNAQPVADIEICEQDAPDNSVYSDSTGFFRLKKRENAVSRWLLIKNMGTIVDSISIIGSSAGERINYYFTDNRKDTLFLHDR